MKTTLAAGLALLLAWAGLAPARAEPYSPEQAVAHALAHNPELHAAFERTRAAAESTAAAEAGRQPQLGARYLLRRSDNPLDVFADRLNTRSVTVADFDPARLNDPGGSTLHATELSLTWPLYTGGRIEAAIREARGGEEAARLQYRRARAIVAHHTLVAYRNAQAAAEAARLLGDAVRAAQAHADTTARLLRERRIVASDNLSAEVNLALVQSQHEQAVTRARHALDRLKLLMGLPPHAEVEPAAWQEPVAKPVPADLATLEHRALAERADLQALAALAAASRARIDAARAAFRPQLSVGAAHAWYDDRPALANSSSSLMGMVSMNLYSGGRDRHQVSAARHQAAEAESQLEAARQQAIHEVRVAYATLEEARRRVEICADNVGKARRAVELVRSRYGEGRTLLLDLLQAERVLTESRLEKLNASLALVTAEAALALAVGASEPDADMAKTALRANPAGGSGGDTAR